MALPANLAGFSWIQPIIEAGAAVRASTGELWAEIRGAAAEEGRPLGPGAFQAVNVMRGEAAARRRGYETFQKARDPEAFTWAHAAPEFNVRPAAERAILPEFLVRFDVTYTDIDGQLQTKTVSMRDSWRPGMTVGDVRAAVVESAEGMNREDNGTLYGTIEAIGNLRPVTI